MTTILEGDENIVTPLPSEKACCCLLLTKLHSVFPVDTYSRDKSWIDSYLIYSEISQRTFCDSCVGLTLFLNKKTSLNRNNKSYTEKNLHAHIYIIRHGDYMDQK